MKRLELLKGGGGDLIVKIGRLRQHFLSSQFCVFFFLVFFLAVA